MFTGYFLKFKESHLSILTKVNNYYLKKRNKNPNYWGVRFVVGFLDFERTFD